MKEQIEIASACKALFQICQMSPIRHMHFRHHFAADRNLWVADNATSKIVKFDMEGHFLYSWGSQGQWPGAMWNVHGISVDQEGNLYLAEVNNGRPQKFRPREGANPDFVTGLPLRAAWE